MARVLCIDTFSNALDLLMRAQAAGHSVKWYDKSKKDGSRPTAGNGIVPKIEDFSELQRKWLDWADLIWLPDNTAYLDMLEPYRRRGYPIFGPSPDAARLELDREAGQKAFRDAGLAVIDGKTFHDYKDAIRYVEKENKAFVSKPSGDADKALSYVAKTPADLVFMLERWAKNPDYVRMARKDGFILQEKVTGTEMAVGGHFGPGGWSKWFVENFEHKKLFPGDMGPNTGEMGTLTRCVRKSKLADEVLLPLTPILEDLGYVGYIDNNCIIEENGKPRPLELTMRDGWPLKHNITAMMRGDPVQWMIDLVHGTDSIEAVEGQCCVSVVIALPPFPYQHVVRKDLDGIPVYNAHDTDHLHLSEVRLGADVPQMEGEAMLRAPSFVTSGEYPLVVTGCGPTVSAARRSAYSAVRKIEIPNDPFYRQDIGAPKRLLEGIPRIQAMGYAKGLVL